jgi:hypothetical protein
LKSEFLAEGSVLGFHVAARNRGVFIHQYSSVLGKPTFSTQSTHSSRSASTEFGRLLRMARLISLQNETHVKGSG